MRRDAFGVRHSAFGIALALLIGLPVQAPAQEWPSERPPRPLVARDVKFPSYAMKTLANGLQVIAVSHHEQPAVSLRLLVRAGAAQDPANKPGVASLAAMLLDQGTTTRSAQDIAGSIDQIGGAIGAGAGTDLTFVQAVVMKDSFDFALALVSDVARNPAFAAEEIDRQRSQILSSLKVSYEDPEYLANVVFDRLVYGFHPYGKPNTGTPESISRLTRDDLVGFHSAYFAPNNAILAIVGDVTHEEAFKGAERAFGDWQRRPDATPPTPAPPPDPTRRVVIVDRPGAVQTEIRVGHLALPRKHPDYLAVDLATKILGGEGSNRLHRVLRSERGLTYGASADLETMRQSGDIVAETDTRSETTGEALRLVVDEYWKLQRERVGSGELQGAKDYLAGSFPLTIETPSDIALQVLNAVFYGLDLEELQTFRDRVNAVSVDDIQRVAKTYFKPDRLSIVLVGDASVFEKQLAAAGFPQFERISLSELDLSSADLRRSGSRAPAAKEEARDQAEPSKDEAKASYHKGSDYLRRAIEAKGGLERLRAVRTARAETQTTLVTPDGPVKTASSTYIAYPDRFRVEAALPTGRLVQVYAGGDAWVRGPAGLTEASSAERERFRAGAGRDIISLLLRAERGEIATRALPDVREGDRQLQVLELAGGTPEAVTLFLDPQTALIVRQGYRIDGPGGPADAEELFSDYRTIDGIQVAFRAVVRQAGATVVEREVTRFAINIPLDDALFRKPL
jgi:predicted Zn-dependent peptidase